MPAKMSRSAPRPPFRLREVSIAVRTLRLSCRKAGKAPIFTPVRESSGESRFKGMDYQCGGAISARLGADWAARLAVVLAVAGLSAGCWQPLYGSHPGGEGVQDKFAAVDIPPVAAPKGTPTERVAVGMHNALQFDLHNGGSPAPTVYVLKVSVYSTQYTAYIDPTTGRPDTQIQIVIASYQLAELATGKAVVVDTTIARVDYDIPGSQQRFAGQRARRDAEDRAIQVAADAIRNQLASYFVAGT